MGEPWKKPRKNYDRPGRGRKGLREVQACMSTFTIYQDRLRRQPEHGREMVMYAEFQTYMYIHAIYHMSAYVSVHLCLCTHIYVSR